jgi:hypothetical protein
MRYILFCVEGSIGITLQSNWYEVTDGNNSTRDRGLQFDIGMWAYPLFYGQWPDEMKSYTNEFSLQKPHAVQG